MKKQEIKKKIQDKIYLTSLQQKKLNKIAQLKVRQNESKSEKHGSGSD